VTVSTQAFGGTRKEQTTTAAHIKNMLVSGPGVKREHEVAVMELANFYVEEIETSFSKQEERCPKKHRMSDKDDWPHVNTRRKKKTKNETEKAEEKEIA
jgi:hypothetical protein